MTDRSYSDLSDSATTFDPEEQFDRDIDERMKGMTKEEAVARALLLVTAKKPASPNGVDLNVLTLDPDFDDLPQDCTEGTEDDDITQEAVILLARAAIAAADKWDAEQQTLAAATDLLPRQHLDPDKWPSRSNISAGQDAAIQEELDHPPAPIMEEGK